jgi:hypothetical protein
MTDHQSRTKSQPHRFRVTVPVADEAVVAWMGLQDNPSLSVRLLIRESIERMGYVDVVNRPVAQLPRRGRPAGSEGAEGPEENPAPTAPAQPSQPAASPSRPARPVPDVRHQAPAAAASTELDLSGKEDTGPELPGIAVETPTLVTDLASNQDPANDPSPAPSNPEQPSGGQIQEVNDIFATLRQ